MQFASLLPLCAAVLITAAGTAVQGSIGFGLAMVAAPLLHLLDPGYIPGPLIAVAFVLSIWVVWSERSHIDYSIIKVGLAGRLIGSPLAGLLLGVLSAHIFDLVFATLVLLAVGLSLLHSDLKPTPRNVFIATIASGFMGPLSSIGGPPLALLYQHSRGPALRANLSILFLLGTLVSLVTLAVVGRFGLADLGRTGILLVGVIPGVLLSRPLKRHVDKRHARPFLLVMCAMSACLVLWRGLSNLY